MKKTMWPANWNSIKAEGHCPPYSSSTQQHQLLCLKFLEPKILMTLPGCTWPFHSCLMNSNPRHNCCRSKSIEWFAQSELLVLKSEKTTKPAQTPNPPHRATMIIIYNDGHEGVRMQECDLLYRIVIYFKSTKNYFGLMEITCPRLVRSQGYCPFE